MKNQHNTPKEHLLVFAASLLCVIIILLAYQESRRDVRTDHFTIPMAKLERRTNVDAFDEVALAAKSAIVWDVERQEVIYEKNANTSLPLASLTKVMTAITAASLASNLTIVPIDTDFLKAEGDSGLIVQERWKMTDLLKFSLTMSSNDAARAVASVAAATNENAKTDFATSRKQFVSHMNAMAKEIGLEKSFFTNENGLDYSDDAGGAYGSAKDVAKLFSYAILHHPDLMESTVSDAATFTTIENNQHVAINTNKIIDLIPGAIASKTGYTQVAGGNLAIAFDPLLGRPIVIAVLGSTAEGRFTDVEQLIGATRNYFK